MNDGTQYRHRQDHAVGRGIKNPMSEEELWEKYSDCAAVSVTRESAEKSFRLLSDIESLSDISIINDALEPESRELTKRTA